MNYSIVYRVLVMKTCFRILSSILIVFTSLRRPQPLLRKADFPYAGILNEDFAVSGETIVTWCKLGWDDKIIG